MDAGIHPSWLETSRHYRHIAYRNIVSLRRSRNTFARISDDALDADVAVAAQVATQDWDSQVITDRPFDLSYGVIGFPFVRKHWAQSRYSDGSFGVWYGSDTIETTVYETAHHFIQELAGRGWGKGDTPITRERRVATADVDALMFDLSDMASQVPALVADSDYRMTQAIGRYIRENRHPGLLAPSARCSAGFNVNVFSPDYLSNPKDACSLRYRYVPGGGLDIERESGKIWMAMTTDS